MTLAMIPEPKTIFFLGLSLKNDDPFTKFT